MEPYLFCFYASLFGKSQKNDAKKVTKTGENPWKMEPWAPKGRLFDACGPFLRGLKIVDFLIAGWAPKNR